MESFVYGVIGGLISSLLYKFINDYQEKVKIQKGLFNELSDLKIRLLIGAFKIAIEVKLFDEDFFNWYKLNLKKSKDSSIGTYLKLEDFFKAFENVSVNSKFILDNFSNAFESISIPIVFTPYLNSRAGEIHLLNLEMQILLNSIIRNISMYNFAASQVEKWNQMSFTVEEKNYQNCVINEKVQLKSIFNSTQVIIDEITKFQNEFEKSII